MPRPNRLRIGCLTILALTLGSARSLAQDPPDGDLARELPRIKPLDPKTALASFRVPPGFRLEAIATEPLVTDPVSVCYDADGRLYVAEMRGYPYPEASPTGYIRRLEDSDGDGRFDRSTIFVEGLSWPTSVVPYDGGVFIAVAPDILYAKDTDGDGVADLKKVAFTGFGTGNVQALLNGLIWGPDGWIYGASGGNGGEIRNPSRPSLKPVTLRSRDFRFKPDGSALEAISGGGQFGHCFDDWGHRFVCNNSDHIRQIVLPSKALERNPALVVDSVVASISVEGAAAPVFRISPAEPWRVVRTRQRAADPAFVKRLPPTELVPIGFFTSATGITIYRGNAFPETYRGNAFIGDVGGNLVHRKSLSRHSAHFEAKRTESNHEFLASTDNWFRPVNFANTPGGTLLILDMYRETIEHPLSIPEPIKKHLDLTSGKDLGRLYELVPEGNARLRKPVLGRASTAELVDLLDDPSGWWRETAQRLLVERNDARAIPLLKEFAHTAKSALGRVHACWTLDTLGSLSDVDLLPAFTAKEPEVREQAAKLAEGKLSAGSSLVAPLLALARDPDPMVRFQTAIALGDLKDDRALDALADIVERDASDRWTRAAVLSALAHRSSQLIDRLAARGFLKRSEAPIWLEELAVLVGAETDKTARIALVASYLKPETELDHARAVLVGLGRGLRRSGGSLRALLDGPSARSVAPLLEKAATTASQEGPIPARVNAIHLLALGPIEPALKSLSGLLDPRIPGSVQLAAIQALGDVNDPRVTSLILDRWKVLSPSLKREAMELLFARSERTEKLVGAIESQTVSASDLDPERRTRLLNHPDQRIRARARKVLEGISPPDRKEVLDAYRDAGSLPGDREKGRLVFTKVCATCHKAEGVGLNVGPDLATVAGRSADDLLVHILDPNREVAPGFVNYTVAMTDGRIFTGLIADESANSLTLKRAEGATDEIARSRIDSIASSGRSLMPEGLEKGLTPQDLADLIAFIRKIGTPSAR
jgi:putative membrane-bound dehydrogenase-like protein